MSHQLALKNLSITYASRSGCAVDGFECVATGGAVLGIIGNNGSGKSTLAHAIIGVIPHLIPGRVTGEAGLDGEALLSVDLQTRLASIGYTFQDAESQILFGTVRDVLGISPGAEPHPLLREAIELLRVGHLLERLPDELSGGEAQRVALLTALRRRPVVLLYDEASSALDPHALRDFAALVGRLREVGLVVILLGQRPALLAPHCDHLLGMLKGRMVAIDEAAPRPPLSPASFWDELHTILPPDPNPPPELRLSGVLVRRPGTRSFSLGPLDLTLRAGEVVALLGPNGSGKTTLLLLLLGAIKAHGGSFALGGRSLSPRRWRSLPPPVTMVTQSPLSRLIGSTIGEEFGTATASSSATEIALCQSLLLRHFPHLDFERDPLQLSFGQQRVLTMLVSLLGNQPLLLLDEPEQGLDLSSLDYVKAWIRSDRRSERRSVLFSTHDLGLAAELADRCILIDQGRFVAETTTHDPVALEEWYFRNAIRRG